MDDNDLIILDEPMNGLDKNGVSDVRRILMELKEKGKTIIIASHNPLGLNSKRGINRFNNNRQHCCLFFLSRLLA